MELFGILYSFVWYKYYIINFNLIYEYEKDIIVFNFFYRDDIGGM